MACGPFFNAPVPSGWTFTIVLSQAHRFDLGADNLLFLHLFNSLSSTPALAQRFMRI
jgi:hypothetical protein